MPGFLDELIRVESFPFSLEVFEFNDQAGKEWCWNVSAGIRIAEASGRELFDFHISDHELTMEKLLMQNPSVNIEYAMTRDMSKPILFVPFAETDSVLIDGWHRLARAIMEGVPFLQCHLLTQEEADSILITNMGKLQEFLGDQAKNRDQRGE